MQCFLLFATFSAKIIVSLRNNDNIILDISIINISIPKTVAHKSYCLRDDFLETNVFMNLELEVS